MLTGSGKEVSAVLGSGLIFPSNGLDLASVGDSTFFVLIWMPGTEDELNTPESPGFHWLRQDDLHLDLFGVSGCCVDT